MFLCFFVSLLGIVQHFTSEAKIYGLRTLTSGGDPFGPFVNRNHFAGFVELTLPAGLAMMIFRGLRRDMFPLAGLLTIVPLSAMMLSGSRGGIVSFAFEIAVLMLLARSLRTAQGPRLAALAMVGFAALALVVWLGAGKAIERFSVLHPGDVPLSSTLIDGSRRCPYLFRSSDCRRGTGLARCRLSALRNLYDGKIVDHVHNDYMELLAETGILGSRAGSRFFGYCFAKDEDASPPNRAIFPGRFTPEPSLRCADFCFIA